MHGLDASPPAAGSNSGKPWHSEMTRYHWFVLLVAALGWLFDCLDQQLFVLARPAAMNDLVPAVEGVAPAELQVARNKAGDYATMVFILGWASGGLFFGMLGDRIGRAKTMIITILLYSLFTGLSALSRTPVDFAIYRFLTGLGVGGEFAVGVALVAEVMPASARPQSLALLQALSAIGNISAALINLGFAISEEQGLVTSPWRIMFLIGAIPALLALVIRRRLKEPEQWKNASHEGAAAKQLGSYRDLFRDPTLRRHALAGLALGCSGVIGLWSVGFYTPDLIRLVQKKQVTTAVYNEATETARAAGDQAKVGQVQELLGALNEPAKRSGLSEAAKKTETELQGIVNGRLSKFASYTSIAINVGAALGMFGFGTLASRIGRKPTFVIALLAAFFTTVSVFLFLEHFWQIWVMVPIMGFCQLSLFAGFAIYFPELFPTRLRSTGTSFCYNVGRFVAAFGLFVKPLLTDAFKHYPEPLNFRYAGVTMCAVFLIGLFALPFLPETKGKPLPE